MDVRIQAIFHESENLIANFGEVIEVQHGFDPYEGPYEVNPMFVEQILETKDKSMTDDVTVKEIAVYRTENPSGGNTVIIGG